MLAPPAPPGSSNTARVSAWALRAAAQLAAGAADFVLLEVWERQRAAMWCQLGGGGSPLMRTSGPVLLVYAWHGDDLCDPQK